MPAPLYRHGLGAARKTSVVTPDDQDYLGHSEVETIAAHLEPDTLHHKLVYPVKPYTESVYPVKPLNQGGPSGKTLTRGLSRSMILRLASTLEEYEHLLGLPLARSVQYFHQDQPSSWAVIAKLLKTSEEEMTRAKRNRNRLEGLPRIYLEERLDQLQGRKDWPVVMDALGLLVYEILLFPQVEDHVDLVAMGVFLAKKDRGENPTMAVLANTYYTLNQCGEQKRGILRCCTLLLYLWLTAHLFHCKHRTTCPIEDFKWSWIQPMTKEEWVRKLDEASEKTIRWYPHGTRGST
ncbi:hypothetical protein CR513_09799, partial [Mucuna pruriens]